ncbi:hypothetical protein LY76DRAFT_148374 [Colletotrichum caudatum]|nr:hypothetical protein LY76DRAFT_148374 [Colletotrichum caudatum]
MAPHPDGAGRVPWLFRAVCFLSPLLQGMDGLRQAGFNELEQEQEQEHSLRTTHLPHRVSLFILPFTERSWTNVSHSAPSTQLPARPPTTMVIMYRSADGQQGGVAGPQWVRCSVP